MFIGRRPDGTIYGAWTMRQPDDADHPGVEEVVNDHPDLVAFRDRPQPVAKDIVDQIAELSPARLAALKAELAR